MDYNLQGKSALVTGGSHGIGLAICESLGRAGCRVAFCGRTLERLDKAKDYLDSLSIENLAIQADVLQEYDCRKVLSTIKDQWSGVDILINNVGGGGRWGKENVETTDLTVWDEVYTKNARAAIIFTTGSIPYMRAQKWGRVITITSKLGKEGGGRPWFNMAKASEVSLMKTLSLTKYLVRDGITFNSVAPGGIYIEGTGFEQEKKANEEKFHAEIDTHFPLGRMGRPDEVAHLVAFLSSELSSLINGAQITVDGGESKAF